MTEQERFEKLVSSEPFFYDIEKTPSGYKQFAVNELRAMWIAGRADAYQEAQEYYMTSWAKDETRDEK